MLRAPNRWKLTAAVGGLSVGVCVACQGSKPTSGGEGGAEAVAEASGEIKRRAAELARRSVNPDGLKPYVGPMGGVRGVVTVAGDAPPITGKGLEKISSEKCASALGMYGKLFRKGPKGTIADVLVTVTGYEGYLPAKSKSVPVRIKGCAWDTRTVALMVGQHLQISNQDPQSYMPRLAGSPTPALRVVMAGGAPIPLFAPKAGAYRLVAETRPHMGADVFVVRYPTTDVTGLDGEFEVMNIPTGSVTVTAFSPAIGIRSRVTQEILIKEGEVVDLPLVLRFSEADYQKTQAPAATPNRSTTGSP